MKGCFGGDTCVLLQWLHQKEIQIRTLKDYPYQENGMSGPCLIKDDFKGESFVKVNKFSCKK